MRPTAGTISARGGGYERRYSILLSLVISIALLFFLMSGVAMTTNGADPDSLLYPVKRAMEDLHTTVTLDSVSKAEIEAGHAEARLAEVDEMVTKGRSDLVPSLLADYQEHVSAAHGYRTEAVSEGKAISDLDARMAALDDRLNLTLIEYAGELPEELHGAIGQAFEQSAYRKTGIGGHYGGPVREGAAEPAASSAPGSRPMPADDGATAPPEPGRTDPGQSGSGNSGHVPPGQDRPDSSQGGNGQGNDSGGGTGPGNGNGNGGGQDNGNGSTDR